MNRNCHFFAISEGLYRRKNVFKDKEKYYFLIKFIVNDNSLLYSINIPFTLLKCYKMIHF